MYIADNYKAHEKHFADLFADEKERESRIKAVTDYGSEHYARNSKILELALPFCKGRNYWLIVGDYNGFEAHWLGKRGQNALASNIECSFLCEAYKRKLINDYLKINALEIGRLFLEDSFDYVLCKESLHHMPLPFEALRNMLHVASKAVIVLGEPNDPQLSMPSLMLLRNVLDRFNKKWIKKIWKNQESYEYVYETFPIMPYKEKLNYVYKFSRREIEKFCDALDLKVEFTFSNLNKGIFYKLLNKLHIVCPSHISFIIYKDEK